MYMVHIKFLPKENYTLVFNIPKYPHLCHIMAILSRYSIVMNMSTQHLQVLRWW